MADFVGIHYPNGSVEGVQVFIWDGSKPILWDGSITFSGTITIGAITGNKTNNNAAPSTDNIGVLPAIANAAAPTWTEGRQVLLSTDLSGNTRVIVSAGSALIGKVGIDQTTPGTTNAVAPISGQNGVAGNTGVVGATTQRVVLATDVGLPAGTAVIGNTKDAGYQNTTWAVHHIPSANTQATITQASAGGSTKNVCLSLTVTLASSSTTAPAAIQLTVSLIDGASGGTTYLWRTVISLPAVAGAISSFNIKTPHGFEGTAATAMTLEFSAAGGANTIESVSMYGTTRL